MTNLDHAIACGPSRWSRGTEAGGCGSYGRNGCHNSERDRLGLVGRVSGFYLVFYSYRRRACSAILCVAFSQYHLSGSEPAGLICRLCSRSRSRGSPKQLIVVFPMLPREDVLLPGPHTRASGLSPRRLPGGPPRAAGHHRRADHGARRAGTSLIKIGDRRVSE